MEKCRTDVKFTPLRRRNDGYAPEPWATAGRCAGPARRALPPLEDVQLVARAAGLRRELTRPLAFGLADADLQRVPVQRVDAPVAELAAGVRRLQVDALRLGLRVEAVEVAEGVRRADVREGHVPLVDHDAELLALLRRHRL